MTPDLERLVGAIALFSDHTPEELREMLALVRPCSFPPGATLFTQGDEADGMYLIERGRVRVSERLLGEHDVELAILGAGAVLGELALVDSGTRSATAHVLEPTDGLFLSRRHFDLLRGDFRPAAYKTMRRLARELCGRVRALNREIAAASSMAVTGGMPSWVRPSSALPGRPLSPSTLDRDVLDAIPFFSRFTPAEYETFVSPLRRWDLQRGQMLFAEGDTGTSCFIIVRGAVQVAVANHGGIENLAVLGPGKLLGHMSLMDGEPRSATCYVRENAVLLEMERAVFERLIEGGSNAAFKFFDELVGTLIEAVRGSNRYLGRLAAEGRVPLSRLGVDEGAPAEA